MKLQSLDLFQFVQQYVDMPSDLSKVKTITVTAHADVEAEIKVVLNEIKEEVSEVVEDIKEFFGYGAPIPESAMPPVEVLPDPVKVTIPPVNKDVLQPVVEPVEVSQVAPNQSK